MPVLAGREAAAPRSLRMPSACGRTFRFVGTLRQRAMEARQFMSFQRANPSFVGMSKGFSIVFPIAKSYGEAASVVFDLCCRLGASSIQVTRNVVREGARHGKIPAETDTPYCLFMERGDMYVG